MSEQYALAKKDVFWTIQGEAHLRGFQMCFVRLAGCSIGCPQCDTDYTRDHFLTAKEIVEKAESVTPRSTADRWVWITGGEPADLPQLKQRELINAFAAANFRVAVASSGAKPFVPPVDWLSISPHSTDKLAQPYGNEIKLVLGLNRLDQPDEFLFNNPGIRFMYQYIQPISNHGVEDRNALISCIAWLKSHPNWSLSRQDHHYWGVA